jgi:hypothetical protein
LLGAGRAGAWVDQTEDLAREDPHGIHVLDGSYVMNVSNLQINITNFGLIGSRFSQNSTFSEAPSAQWPAGSGVEYLWCAGLWVGGVVLGEKLVSTGQYEFELRPHDDIRDTIYEARGNKLIRPAGNDIASGKRAPDPGQDDDSDGKIDEEVLNGYDDDGDGLIDEDFAQIGNQMMVCTIYDNTRLAQEQYPDHTPMNLEIRQQSYAWEADTVDDFVGFEFFIKNIGVTSIDNVYIGFFADCDVGPRSRANAANDDMAGFWEGMVQASDGSWVPVSIGYMYDDDGDSGLTPGYFGILFLGHDTDPTGQTAPPKVAIRSFQSFTGDQTFDQGGDPRNDGERYELLSRAERDQSTPPGKQNDWRFMVSGGPFKTLDPDKTLRFQAAMVAGNGLSGMLKNAAEAALTWYGNWFNADQDATTGRNGRETKICQEDFQPGPTGQNPIFSFWADYMDTSCVTKDYLLSKPHIGSSDLTQDENGKHCIYVNLDNCFECSRQNGQFCTKENQDQAQPNWNCWDPSVPDDRKAGCTGIGGNESDVHWLVGMAPPPPGIRLLPTDNSVHVFWDDSSENAKDLRLNVIDFESYRIWRADNWTRPFGSSLKNGPEAGLWQLIGEYDLKDYYYRQRSLSGGGVVVDTLPLGANTGLDAIRYVPRCLADTIQGGRFQGLPSAMREVVRTDSLGLFQTRPTLRDHNGVPIPSLRGLLPWEGYPTELDTFFAVTPRYAIRGTISAKRSTKYYEYVDHGVHNGFIYFYSVTATDHDLKYAPGASDPYIAGTGQSGDPGSSFSNAVPGGQAQTVAERKARGANIYVYPNPATRQALADFQQLYPNADDMTGVRVVFANLPAARNTIKIFTEDGDLVQTIKHDGTAGYGSASWNLVSRNGQEIVSGIYLFSVQSDNKEFADFIGKFVVVR